MGPTLKPMENLISLRNVTKEYPGTKILNSINLEVTTGEFITVVGPSGCGKSTLLNGIGGFSTFSSGSATLSGRVLGQPDRNRGIVFQDSTIPEFLSVYDNVAIGFYLEACHIWHHFIPFYHRIKRKQFAEKTNSILARVGLQDKKELYPRQLSGGQKQRVAIAQALVLAPKVLLMDEPFSALDPHTRRSLQEFLLELQKETGMTIFFVTHDLDEAIYLGDRTIVLSQLNQEEPGATIVLDIKNPSIKAHTETNSEAYKAHKKIIWESGFVKK